MSCTRQHRFQISIHAPHTRGDRQRRCPRRRTSRDFNPRPSYEGRPSCLPCRRASRHFNPRPSYEGRRLLAYAPVAIVIFQSTPLIRGATAVPRARRTWRGYFNPRPSYEGRHCIVAMSVDGEKFQSTPLIRGATMPRRNSARNGVFQSTPLIRGATRRRRGQRRDAEISIHAPHTRGDVTRQQRRCSGHYFNPRPSYEGRPLGAPVGPRVGGISIHAPHTRGDYARRCSSVRWSRFQSTPLIRGATTSPPPRQ